MILDFSNIMLIFLIAGLLCKYYKTEQVLNPPEERSQTFSSLYYLLLC